MVLKLKGLPIPDITQRIFLKAVAVMKKNLSHSLHVNHYPIKTEKTVNQTKQKPD